MAQYRKRPVVVEAWQWNPEKPSDYSPATWPQWMTGRDVRIGFGDQLKINTLEGVMTAIKGDWIIRGVKGEIYPCKPDIFAATYEPATPTEAGETKEG
jgi:hypothetical protein